jgi:predicted double-glycine peptidase
MTYLKRCFKRSVATNVKSLAVPYEEQSHLWSCGPAALNMVYRYYGTANVGQSHLYKKLRKKDCSSEKKIRRSSAWCVYTEDLIDDAKERGFSAKYDVFDVNDARKMKSQLLRHLRRGVPIIACQRYTADERYIGHYRVIVAVTEKAVIVHDPCRKIGGPSQSWPLDPFMSYWRRSGPNTRGGVGILVKRQ